MSSRAGKKHKSKAVDRSTSWSAWGWDEANQQEYRTRYDANGTLLYDTRAAAQVIPRGSTDVITQYATTAVPGEQRYYTSDSYTSTAVDTISNRFQNVSFADEPIVVRTPSYYTSSSSTLPSQAAHSIGDGGARPINVRTDPTRSVPSEYRTYSSSAPVSTNAYTSDFSDSTTAATLGDVPEYSTGFDTRDNEQSLYVDNQLTQTESYRSYTSTSTASPLSTAYTSPSIGKAQLAAGSNVGTIGGIPANETHKTISGTDGKEESLDPKFKVNHSKNFKPGQVFKMLWSEPGGETASNATDVTSFTVHTKFGEKVHSTIRRFVIVASDRGHCQCLPILTYGRQGTGKWGVNPEDHAIIYTGDRPPQQLNGEATLKKAPIKMISKNPRHKLEPASRINYAKIYTVEHNVKVCFIGWIAEESVRRLMTDFDATWNNKRQLGGNY